MIMMSGNGALLRCFAKFVKGRRVCVQDALVLWGKFVAL